MGEPITNEQSIEFLQLEITKQLLASTPDEWTKQRNEFVSLSIPVNISEFISSMFPEHAQEDLLSSVITDLIMRGINSLYNEYGKGSDVEELVSDVLNPLPEKSLQ